MSLYPSGATPLSGKYLVKSPLLRAGLEVRDAFWRLTAHQATPPIPSRPTRILLAVGGQLGDAVIATSPIRQLGELFPDADIGILCSAQAAVVFEDHPKVKRLHRYDHWFPGHRAASAGVVLNKWRRARAGRSSLIREIRDAKYDVAIDLYPFFPSSAPILAAARVPVRVGYSSGGGGPLLTHSREWHETRRQVAGQHTELLASCWADVAKTSEDYSLAPVPPEDRQRARALLASKGIDGPYAVLHPGTSEQAKRWPAARWQELVVQLRRESRFAGLGLAFTGQGAADSHFIDEIRAVAQTTVSLNGETSWQLLRGVLEGAAFAITADSVAGHLSAAAHRPTVVVTAGNSDPMQWKPLGNHVAQVMSPVPCAPCFLTKGCATMDCIRKTTSSDVVSALTGIV